MKLIKKMALVIAGLLLLLVTFVALPGIPREDVLECGLPDGSKFVLRAKYKWQPLSIIAPIRKREHQENWGADYIANSSAPASHVPTSIDFSNTFDQTLREACAEVGKRDGVPLVAYSYLQANGEWFPVITDALWKKLAVPYVPSKRSEPLKSALEKAGMAGTTFMFSLVMPRHGHLIYEQPLSKYSDVYYYDQVFEGVYQSISSDGGKTWSEPVITTKAKIFEMGKPWLDQCFVARPIKLNGKKIEPDFPAPCPPRPE